MRFYRNSIQFFMAAAFLVRVAAAAPITPDLKSLAEGKGAKIPDSVSASWVPDVKGKPAIQLKPKSTGRDGDGILLLDGVTFENGVIEFDALGQSAPPQSNFLGVAFRVADDKKYDVVYFRPFNFRAEDAERKSHAVQYISHPDYPWQVTRKNSPGKYEKPIEPAPDGDQWFHARIVVKKPSIQVYVNDAKEPSLVADELSDRKDGGIGLWVGPGVGGHFANLKVTPDKP